MHLRDPDCYSFGCGPRRTGGWSVKQIPPWTLSELEVVPYGVIASAASTAGALKPKIAKPAGAVAGAATGAKAGSVFGPVGTAVGAVVGAAASLLGGKKVATSEQAWDAYKPIAGSQPGRSWPAKAWEWAFEGMWKTNNKRLAGVNRTYPSREPFKEWLVNAIAKAIQSGQLAGTLTAEQVAQIVLFPEMDRLGVKYQDYPAMRYIFIDLVDRIITDQPFTRAQVPGIGGGNQPKISTLKELMEKQFSATAPSQPPVTTGSASPVTTVKTPPSAMAPPLQLPAPGPVQPIPQISSTPSQSDIDSLTNAIVSNMVATGRINLQAPDSSSTNIALQEVMRYLGTAGVRPSQQLTQAVAETAKETIAEKKNGGKTMLIVAGLGLAGLLIYSLSRKRR